MQESSYLYVHTHFVNTKDKPFIVIGEKEAGLSPIWYLQTLAVRVQTKTATF